MAIPITDELKDALDVLAGVVDEYGKKSTACPTKRSIKLRKDVYDSEYFGVPSKIKEYTFIVVRNDIALTT